jgi:type I restriction enzyme S subunit
MTLDLDNRKDRTTVKARDYCHSVRDGTHDSPKSVEDGFPLVTSRHLKSGKLDIGSCYRISPEDYASINKRSKVDQWDVLVSMIGTVGEVFLIKENPCFAVKNIGIFKTKSENDGRWLYYYLNSPQAQNYLREHARGTTQQYVPLNTLREMPILISVDESEMVRIASILGTLDDKIENNRKMAKTLEAMAQAIFQSWFVDFDPVRAKMAGESRESICKRLKITPEILDQFPDRLVDSELGEIPEGWDPIVLSKLFIERKERDQIGLLPEYSSTNNGVIPRNLVFNKSKSTQSVPNKVIHFGDFVFGLSRKVLNFGVMTDNSGSVSPAYRVFSIRDEKVNPLIIEKLIRANHDYYYQALSASTREGQSISLDSFNVLYLPSIPNKIQIAYLSISDSIMLMQKSRNVQATSLVALRDTLLPKLISGEIRIPVSEHFLESVIR